MELLQKKNSRKVYLRCLTRSLVIPLPCNSGHYGVFGKLSQIRHNALSDEEQVFSMTI